MTRQTVSPAPTAREADELARAAATAAALIELAIHESLAPMEALGRALSNIAAQAPETLAELRTEICACIENLQFHDRMVQQLTQVRDLLAGVINARPAMANSAGWPALRERLRAHFTSESHRMLFNLLLPGEGEGVSMHLHAEQGTVELF